MSKLNAEAEYQRLLKRVDIEQLLDLYDISYRKLSGSKGVEYQMRCPLPGHDDRCPSFCINGNTGIYNCFVCGGGNIVTMIQKIEKVKFFKAIEIIKKKLGIFDKTESDFDQVKSDFEGEVEKKHQLINRKMNFVDIKLPKCEPAQNYYDIVKKRVTLEMIKRWDLKYCVNDRKYSGRLIIPIYCYGKLVNFAARDMLGKHEEWKKRLDIAEKELSREQLEQFILKFEVKKILYPYGTETKNIFFNWDDAIKNPEYVILCEGPFDAMKVAMYGYNAVALLSCNLNQFRANKIRKHFKNVYVALDNDDKINKLGKRINPGQEHAIKILKVRLDGMNVMNIVLPFGKDPDECSKEEFDKCFNATKNTFSIW
jgi:DNA primase